LKRGRGCALSVDPADDGAAALSVDYHSVKQIADRLNVAPKTIYKLVRGGELEAVRVGSAIRISEEALGDYLHRDTAGGARRRTGHETQKSPGGAETRGKAASPGRFIFFPP
jgi:excisionase family DNA binding protein